MSEGALLWIGFTVGFVVGAAAGGLVIWSVYRQLGRWLKTERRLAMLRRKRC